MSCCAAIQKLCKLPDDTVISSKTHQQRWFHNTQTRKLKVQLFLSKKPQLKRSKFYLHVAGKKIPHGHVVYLYIDFKVEDFTAPSSSRKLMYAFSRETNIGIRYTKKCRLLVVR